MSINLNTADWDKGGGDATEQQIVTVNRANNVSEGDVEFVLFSSRGADVADIITPNGWTLEGVIDNDLVSWANTIALFSKVAGASEDPTVDIDQTSSLKFAWISGRLSGDVDTTTPFGNHSTVESDTPLTQPSINSSADNLLMAFLGSSSTTNNISTAVTEPASMTKQEEIIRSSSAGCTVAISTEVLVADGATGTREWSWSSVSEEGGAGILIEVNAVSSFTLDVITDNGTVTKNPDKAEYDPDEVVELTADPDQGYKFDSWSGDIGGATPTDNPITVTMDQDRTITANYAQIDNISPEDGATGVSLTPTLNWRPDLTFSGYDNYLIQVAGNANFDSPLLIDEIVSQSDLDVLVGILEHSTIYHWRVKGARITFDATTYSEDFEVADQSGWLEPWVTQVLSGTGSFSIASGRAVMSPGASSRLAANLNGIDIGDIDALFDFKISDVSNDFQPRILLRSSGEWDGGKKLSYWLWFWDGKMYFGKTTLNTSTGNLENSVITNVPKVLSDGVIYKAKPELKDSSLRFKVWEIGQAQPSGWDIDEIDTEFDIGRLDLEVATSSGVAGTETISFDNFSIQQAEEVPVIESAVAGDGEYTINHTEVPNATGYEFREDGGAAQPANSTNGTFTVSPRTNGQTYLVEMRAIVGGTPTSWSNAVEVTPVADSIISVTIDQANADVEVGQTKQLTATVETTGSPDTSLVWSSSDESVTTVDSNGIVEGISEGSAIITATSVANNTKSDSVSSNVTQATEPAEWFSDATIQAADSEQEDKEALARFFQDTNGPTTWVNTTGWSTDPNNIDLSAGNEPFGVEVQTINNERRVTLIRLNNDGSGDPQNNSSDRNGNGLTGFLPNMLGNLKELTHFNVEINNLGGGLPGGMRYCTKMKRFYAEGPKNNPANDLWGEIDEETHLSGHAGKVDHSSYDRDHNNFTGSLPGEYSDWNAPIVVRIANTIFQAGTQEANIEGITGQLPPEWGQWGASLKHIFLNQNRLTGPLPPEWAAWTYVKDVYLGANQLGDPNGGSWADLPPEWGGGTAFGDGMRRCREISLGNDMSGGSTSNYFNGAWINRFNNPIPENWGNMKMMHRFEYPNFNSQAGFEAYWSSGDFHNRVYQSSNWQDPNDPDPDADPIEAYMPGLTELTNINNKISPMLDPANLTYLSRFNAAFRNNDFSFDELPQNLDSWRRMKQFQITSCKFGGNFPDIPSWDDCKIFDVQYCQFNSDLPELAGASGTEWRNIQAQGSNFNGQIPASWGNLPDQTWTRLWLHNNRLSGSIPSGLADNEYGTDDFRIDNNLYVFADIIPVLNSLPNPGDLRYAPQKKFGSSRTYNRTVGGSLNVDPFSGDVSHANNSYQWYKDGSPVSGETNRALSLSNLQLSDAGTYHLEVTNNGAPDLTLQSRDVTVNVS